MRLLCDRYGGTIRGQHPYRDLQSLTRWIHNGNRTVAPLGAANDLENSVAERMERIEDLHARIFCAQGIVGADGFIRMFTVWFPPAAWLRTIRGGSTHRGSSFCQWRCSKKCSGASSQRDCEISMRRANSAVRRESWTQDKAIFSFVVAPLLKLPTRTGMHPFNQPPIGNALVGVTSVPCTKLWNTKRSLPLPIGIGRNGAAPRARRRRIGFGLNGISITRLHSGILPTTTKSARCYGCLTDPPRKRRSETFVSSTRARLCVG